MSIGSDKTMHAWSLNQARFTGFMLPSASPPESVWKAIAEAEPDFNNYTRTTGTRLEQGEFAEGVLLVQTQPFRIDVFYQPAPTLIQESLGPFPTATEPFVRRVSEWLSSRSTSGFFRVALAFVLLYPVSSVPAGYARLAESIEGVPDPNEASEFSQQVNRRKPSQVRAGATINRVSGWSVVSFRAAKFEFGQGIAQSSMLGDERIFVKLELDMNTRTDNDQELLQDELVPMLHELFELAVEESQRTRTA